MNQLILLPGALGHAAQFANLITELETKNINALAIDLVGHGLSPISEEAVTVPLMAEALVVKLDELGLTEPVNIFGHSLGGYLGLYLCLKFPQRVKSVFTLGTKWHWVSEIADIETSMLNPEKMEQKIPKYVEHLKTVHRKEWKSLVNSIAFLMTDLGRYQYLEPESVMGIFHPTRIGLGDRDAMVSLDETSAIYKALPNGQLQVFPNTPHHYEKVDSKKLANEIADFLNL